MLLLVVIVFVASSFAILNLAGGDWGLSTCGGEISINENYGTRIVHTLFKTYLQNIDLSTCVFQFYAIDNKRTKLEWHS